MQVVEKPNLLVEVPMGTAPQLDFDKDDINGWAEIVVDIYEARGGCCPQCAHLSGAHCALCAAAGGN
jgi:hypothetical protein